MSHIGHGALWRANFVGALQLLGQAAARLPFGAPDPVLCGAAAVELYTGSLWPATDLEMYAPEPRPLTTELFAMGFRWAERPRHVDRGLWHPELQIGVSISTGRTPLGLAEISNVLTVVNDFDLGDPAQDTVKILGIEDLIAEQVADRLTRRVPSEEAASLIHVLVGLARGGVGGSFRADYLRRRVAWDTDGEVVFEASLPGDAVAYDTATRLTSLSHMRALIDTWRVRCGFSFDQQRSCVALGPGEKATRTPRYRNDASGRAGGTDATPTNVIPFDAVPPVLSR